MDLKQCKIYVQNVLLLIVCKCILVSWKARANITFLLLIYIYYLKNYFLTNTRKFETGTLHAPTTRAAYDTNEHWSHPAEDIRHGDERVAGQCEERQEREPHGDDHLVVEPVLTEPRHPQVVARRGR
jgi:hypothetical protein